MNHVSKFTGVNFLQRATSVPLGTNILVPYVKKNNFVCDIIKSNNENHA